LSSNPTGTYCFHVNINAKEEINIQKIQTISPKQAASFQWEGRKLSESSPVPFPFRGFLWVLFCSVSGVVAVVSVSAGR